jgi:hypothetical protein
LSPPPTRVRGPLLEKFAVWGLHARNEAMVDGADIHIAFWNGKREAGTYACLRYALTKSRSSSRPASPRSPSRSPHRRRVRRRFGS